MHDNSTTTLGLSISSDDGRFLRQECPRCGMEFKRQADDCDMQDALSSIVRNLYPVSEHEEDVGSFTAAEQKYAYCAYCRYRAVRQDYLHSEIVTYIRRIVVREIIEPMLEKAFSGFSDSSFDGGLVSLQISVSRKRTQRPFHGPEPNDQVVVRCLSCNERFKVAEDWRGYIFCPACSVPLLAQ